MDGWVDGHRSRWTDLSDSFLSDFNSCCICTLKCLIWQSVYFYFPCWLWKLSFSLPFFSLGLYNTSSLINLFNEVHSSGYLQGFAIMKSTGCMGLVVLDSRHDWLVLICLCIRFIPSRLTSQSDTEMAHNCPPEPSVTYSGS